MSYFHQLGQLNRCFVWSKHAHDVYFCFLLRPSYYINESRQMQNPVNQRSHEHSKYYQNEEQKLAQAKLYMDLIHGAFLRNVKSA